MEELMMKIVLLLVERMGGKMILRKSIFYPAGHALLAIPRKIKYILGI